MNPKQNPLQCAVCGESEPSIIHAVSRNSVIRRLCTDCLLKENRELFCPVCLNVFADFTPPQARIVCLNCPFITHLACSPPPSSSTASSTSCFICPPCSDPNFSFFPKSHLPSSDQSGDNNDEAPGTLLDIESATALVAAANIAVVSMNNAAAHLKDEAVKKILEAKQAKMRAKEALENLQDLFLKQKASENNDSKKRKNSDR